VAAKPCGPESASSARHVAEAEACPLLAQQLCREAAANAADCDQTQAIVLALAPAACSAALSEFDVTRNHLKNQRAKCDELASVLCEGVGVETETCALVKERVPELSGVRCAAMLTESDALVADLRKQELQNQPLSQAHQAAIAAAGAPSFGPDAAPVTLVEFSDFECPYCARAADVTKQLRATYGDKIRFVFRQFPLSFHKSARGAAEAGLAAHAQGKFWAFHDAVFEHQANLGPADLLSYAKQAGLNVAAFQAAIESRKFASAVDADVALGELVGIEGTPTLFVNGKRVANPTDLAEVGNAIDRALQ
jgi:protein-disulfide isomerase